MPVSRHSSLRRLPDIPARKFPRPEAADAPGVAPLKDGEVVSTEGATLRWVPTGLRENRTLKVGRWWPLDGLVLRDDRR